MANSTDHGAFGAKVLITKTLPWTICLKYCLKPDPKVIIPCGSTIILFPFVSTAESNA